MERLETLRWLFEVTRESISEAPPDRRSPLIGQLRGIAEEIAELEGASRVPVEPVEVSGLVDFQRKLEERKSGSGGRGKTAAR